MARRHSPKTAGKKKAEGKLRHSDHLTEVLHEYKALGFSRMDRAGTILDCNDTFLEMIGACREHIIGCKGTRFGLPAIEPAGDRAPAGGLAVFEGEYTSAKGDACFLRIAYHAVRSGAESPTDIIATVEDITARKLAEEKIETVSERMKAIFSSINDPIIVHPYSPGYGHRTFSEVNDIACSRYGYSREEFLTLSVKDLIKRGPGQRAQAIERLKKIMAKGHLVFETVHVTKSGEEFPVEVSASVMDLAGEKAVLAVIRDISERHLAEREKAKLESRLQQAQKMESVGRLAGGVAHDFNNMLSVILGHCDMAMMQITPDNPLHKNILEIQKAARHSAELTQQLLAFARKQSIAPKVLDPNKAIGSMLDLLRRLIGEEIVLEWEPADTVWPIMMDPGQLHQILANLSINARDAISGNGGRIHIGTENVILEKSDCAALANGYPGEFVVLSVRDNGQGMEQETLEYIFEPFFTTKGLGEGTGLGLAIVHGIIKQNKGFISVASEPGRGTIFRNFLPRHHGGHEMEQRSARAAEAAPGGQETILLVEDERAILDVITDMLRRQGYQVIPASSPAEALRLARRNDRTIHLLMTDVIMPGMNGRELSKRLQQIYPGLPCLYMSGYTAEVIASHEILEDTVFFLQKPFRHEDLLATLGDIFRHN